MLKELAEMNDKFESGIEMEPDFNIKYAWLVVQLKEINISIDQYKILREIEPGMKKGNSKYSLSFDQNRILASQLFQNFDSKIKETLIQCLDNFNFKNRCWILVSFKNLC
jgi:hypothetical protein